MSKALEAAEAAMTDLPALLSRLEAAEGKDRELDLEIARALVPDVICLRQRTDPVTGERRAGDNEEFVYWTYTASLDAAIALKERVLPGASPAVGQNVHHGYWHARLSKVSDEDGPFTVGEADASTPALALCSAIVKALIAQQEKKESDYEA